MFDYEAIAIEFQQELVLDAQEIYNLLP